MRIKTAVVTSLTGLMLSTGLAADASAQYRYRGRDRDHYAREYRGDRRYVRAEQIVREAYRDILRREPDRTGLRSTRTRWCAAAGPSATCVARCSAARSTRRGSATAATGAIGNGLGGRSASRPLEPAGRAVDESRVIAAALLAIALPPVRRLLYHSLHHADSHRPHARGARCGGLRSRRPRRGSSLPRPDVASRRRQPRQRARPGAAASRAPGHVPGGHGQPGGRLHR